MSRSDPQFNLRIPEALRDLVMNAAKENNRSATAEILARLEASLVKELPATELLPAAKARELSEVARKSIPTVVMGRISLAIRKAVAMGHDSASIDLTDLNLEAIPPETFDELLTFVYEQLSAADYHVEWDGRDSVWVCF